MESTAFSSLALLIDDPKITPQFAEFFLQAQGGLLQGSNKTGMSSILMNSNDLEVSRFGGGRQYFPSMEFSLWLYTNSTTHFIIFFDLVHINLFLSPFTFLRFTLVRHDWDFLQYFLNK